MPQHITLVVRRAIPDGPGTRRLVLQDPDGWPLPRWKPGAHLDIHVPGIGHRAYSMCGDTARADTWEIAVKRETTSRGGSAWVHDVLNEGDVVAASMPRCTFPIADGAARHVMVAGGIGVTPFLAMAHEFERRRAEWALHVLSRGEPPCATALAGCAQTGRIRVYDTTKMARPSWDALLDGGPAPGLHSYCCGPQAMLDGFEEATGNWPAGTTSIEHFVPPTLPAAEGAKAYTLCRSTTRGEMEVEPGGSMLAALWELGAKVDASCEGGICGACEVRWLEGEPIHRDRVLTPERRRTHLLACVAQCSSERLVVET
ncbi:PDR/VanB family oxidoreductase [Siccirubricoccus sp. G192]|uniref:PDR/VanB family oxidoreductase n=1 Tax=Siccirubricoccus sp. G192 TaxID=2849651 RepID=UPI001C2C607B|nr:PDR/VanB family oxidoreductase [Siccirubricoccus sp. G192]MBV1795878.1 PDR/VanB family oxidoreductase [Siccirubricoccus sp. G192]